MRVIGVRRDASRRDPKAATDGVDRIVSTDRFAEVAREADYLAVTAALTPQTRGMVSSEILRALKPTAWVINIARGPIVDEAALVAALRVGVIAAAGLDVYDREPLPPDHPLAALPNVVLLPHFGYVSESGLRDMYVQVVQDIEAFLDGAPIRPVG
jgi:phosphoglycerate dehydrogenase-like enzyme